MILLQVRIRQRQVVLNHLQRGVPQHHLRAPRIPPIPQEIDRKRLPEAVDIHPAHIRPSPNHLKGL